VDSFAAASSASIWASFARASSHGPVVAATSGVQSFVGPSGGSPFDPSYVVSQSQSSRWTLMLIRPWWPCDAPHRH
jgi:hypothetical protein